MTSLPSHDMALTARERLALSRKAIVSYMTQDERPAAEQDRAAHELKNGRASHGTNSAWQNIKHAIRLWWQHHPAQLAVGVAKPVLDTYAREKPLQLLGIAAGAGAAVVLVRPWRLVSMTGLLLATIKSTEFSGLLLSLLSTKPEPTTPKDMP
jgi:hypothetical protein